MGVSELLTDSTGSTGDKDFNTASKNKKRKRKEKKKRKKITKDPMTLNSQ